MRQRQNIFFVKFGLVLAVVALSWMHCNPSSAASLNPASDFFDAEK